MHELWACPRIRKECYCEYYTKSYCPYKFCCLKHLKGAVTDKRYFARSKFSRGLVHEKNVSLKRQVVFELGYVFCQ